MNTQRYLTACLLALVVTAGCAKTTTTDREMVAGVFGQAILFDPGTQHFSPIDAMGETLGGDDSAA